MQRHIPENPRHQRFAFTLVEVIVVAVIVAILAAVAIPNYMQYLEDTRQAAVEQLAETAAASANSWLRRKGEIPDSADLQLHYDATRYTVAFNGDTSITVTDKDYPFSSKVFYK
jgi:prepilin-type N-terminal cleavage/methylation domain-containing protein